MMDLEIIRIPESPMKLVMNRYECIGCFWYGDSFYRMESFTPEMTDLYQKYHASTLKERVENVPTD